MKPINILHYEDKQSYAESFKLLAQKNRILVDSVDNVDELIELLEENPRRHKYVVLDARAYLHEGQGPGSENEANLHKIIRDIDSIGKRQDRVIPYCINTGFAEIKLLYQEVLTCRIFEKGNENELFEFIWDCYNNEDGAKLRMDYPDLFDFVDINFDDASIDLLESLLIKKNFESTKIALRISNLSILRRLLEHTMDIIHTNYLGSDPSIISNRATRSKDIIHELNVRGKVPPQVFGASMNLLKTASNFGSHTPEEATEVEDYPSSNSIKGLTYGYFEIIDWAKKLLK